MRRLVEAGYAEIVLTGVDMTSYGADLPGALTLGKLVRTSCGTCRSCKRLRLSSIDQVEADDAADATRIAEEPRLMPHLHLSLQAGDDMILKRMKRRHLARRAIALLRRRRAGCGPTSCSAPTSSPASRPRPRRCSPTRSPGRRVRADLPARLPVSRPAPARRPRACRKWRARRSRSARRGCAASGEAALARYLQAQVGRDVEVLMERDGLGRTPGFAEVRTRQRRRAPASCCPPASLGPTAGACSGERLAPKCARSERQTGKTRRVL